MLFWIFSGCSASNKMETPTAQENQEVVESNYSIGKVHLNEYGCEIFIVTEGKNKEKLFPVGLEKMFRVNNAVLQFEYDLSRAPVPEKCSDCRAVVLRSITRVKR